MLGPLLFLILMGDIDHGIGETHLSSFADDTNLSRAVHNKEDIEIFQGDLDRVYSWAQENNMTFNADKFELLRCGQNHILKDTTELVTENGQKITTKTHVKCLGVYLSEDATFDHHITATVRRARGMAGWILRTFNTRAKEPMLTLWRSLVQPILDYCSQLWSPLKKKNIQQDLESVQRSFTRNICGMRDLSYWERLKAFGMYSQQRRRDRYCAIYIWKIMEKQVPDPTNCEIKVRPNNRTGRKCERRSLPSTAPQRVRSLLAAASLGHNGPKLFNSLPKEVREITGCQAERFKSALDRFLSTLPDEPPVPGYTSRCRATSNALPDQVNLVLGYTRDGYSGGAPRL